MRQLAGMGMTKQGMGEGNTPETARPRMSVFWHSVGQDRGQETWNKDDLGCTDSLMFSIPSCLYVSQLSR